VRTLRNVSRTIRQATAGGAHLRAMCAPARACAFTAKLAV
jgi:hypothetical protein